MSQDRIIHYHMSDELLITPYLNIIINQNILLPVQHLSKACPRRLLGLVLGYFLYKYHIYVSIRAIVRTNFTFAATKVSA